jgi:LacI family transcriptional regulator
VAATIYQVADLAGVSIATVSRVLRGTAPVASRTRQRVLIAVDELGYRPSQPARSLAEGRHAANGIVFPDLSGPYYAEVVLGYESVAADLGSSVLILSTHGRAKEVPGLVADLASRVDGLVLLGRTVDDGLVSEIAAEGTPVVTVARPPIPGIDAVVTENRSSARALATHLVAHGYCNAHFLGDVDSSFDAHQRWQGLTEAFAQLGCPAPRQVHCAYDEEHGRAAAAELLAEPDRPDALVCANDEIALGALLAAEAAGLRVPDDVSLTGWDDIMAARYSRPGLTTVRQPMRRLGAMAARRLHERVTGERSHVAHEVLPTRLVIRASCGGHPQPDEQEE